MALVIADRVRETTTTTGTGTITLAGAATGYQSFSAIGNSNTTYYVIADQSGTNWEVGIGTYTSSGTTLSRDTVLASSNSGSLVSFGAGTKDVFATYPSKAAVYSDASNAVQLGRSATNYVQAAGAAANLEPVISAQGGDTNVSIALQSKGTGGVDLAAGSTGVNVSNGTTVTALSRLAVGTSIFTSMPTVTISAPTAPGGVQATATITVYAGSATVVSGGTGYTLNDVITLVGGTGTAGTYTVTGVASGVITTVTPLNFGQYSALPASPTAVSVTGGTGSGATLNVGWALGTQSTITNAGSGYVEQPTVTISGQASGSGATAYATVGSATSVKSLGSSVSFFTPSGESFRVQDAGNALTATAAFWVALGQSGGTPSLRATSAAAGSIETASAVSLQFKTSTTLEQMRVSHTASAVNYVQVTGAATTAAPTISAQGSDTNIPIALSSKGTSGIRLQTNGTTQVLVNNVASAVNQVSLNGSAAGAAVSIGAQGNDSNIDFVAASKGTGSVLLRTNSSVTQFAVANTASAANYLQATGAAASSSPSMSSQGSDSNIDLILTPKGTGVIQFGTHTGTTDTAISGYITIKDSGGTTRKLAVIT